MKLKIGDLDVSPYLTSYKVGLNTIVSDDSGRNAQGDNLIEIVTKTPKVKIFCGFSPMTQTEMTAFLAAIGPFIVSVQYYDSRTGQIKTTTVNTGTPEQELYPNMGGEEIYKPFDLNFIEL